MKSFPFTANPADLTEEGRTTAMPTRARSKTSNPKLPVIAPSPLPVGRTDVAGNAVYSRILLSIPDGEYEALLPHLEFVELRLHQSLHESPDGLEYGYFLNLGLTSLVIETEDGRSVEVGIVGREGFVGVPLAAGFTLNALSCMRAGERKRIQNQGGSPGSDFKLNPKFTASAESICAGSGNAGSTTSRVQSIA